MGILLTCFTLQLFFVSQGNRILTGFIEYYNILTVLEELTYVVPTLAPSFTEGDALSCKVFGGLQGFTEIQIVVFVVPISGMILMHIWPKYKACMCPCSFSPARGTGDYYSQSGNKHTIRMTQEDLWILIWWAATFIYACCGMAIWFGLGLVVPRGDRCWASNEESGVNVYGIQVLTYRIFEFTSIPIAIVFGGLSLWRFRIIKSYKVALVQQSDIMVDEDDIRSIMVEENSTRNKFITLVVDTCVRVFFSTFLDRMSHANNWWFNTYSYYISGAIDALFILMCFAQIYIFARSSIHSFLMRF